MLELIEAKELLKDEAFFLHHEWECCEESRIYTQCN